MQLTRFISHLLAGLAALALFLMMLHVTADVLGKYLLNRPIPGTAEVVASYYMVAAVFLPLAWVEVRQGSIVMELLYALLPNTLKRWVYLLATLLSGVFYGGLAWLSWGIAVQSWKIGEVVEGTWRVVIWPTKFLLPIGLALACIVMAIRLIEILAGRVAPHAEIEDPA
ncbi:MULTISPECIES: TRAP transporter small permease subunit [unclassified Nitratireductor]|uniref:TRAP transporter small permease subunit n=1 Tax=unclassified Nitratireductor TaxID=2641084 RepID=UPI0025D18A1E|nr:TRAP transporter small permease [Nitratireductor sp.]